MSARSARARPVDRAAAAAIVLAGCAALMLRLELAGHAEPVRVTALAGLYGTMLVAALCVPLPRERPRARAFTVAVGFLGVLLATVAAGRPAATPWSPWVVPIAVAAAVAEEAVFRRAAYAALAPAGAVVAVGGTAILFALVHVPLYGIGAFPVDLGAGLLFGWQRHASGTWTVPAVTHAAANLMVVLR